MHYNPGFDEAELDGPYPLDGNYHWHFRPPAAGTYATYHDGTCALLETGENPPFPGTTRVPRERPFGPLMSAL